MANQLYFVVVAAIWFVSWTRSVTTSLFLTPRISSIPLRERPLLSATLANDNVGITTSTIHDPSDDYHHHNGETDAGIAAHTKRVPFEQRTQGPRMARRMNSRFRYLYRDGSSQFQNTTAMEYLSQYYSKERILEMNDTFPPLLELNVARHIHPKFRFLQETLHILDSNTSNEDYERMLSDIPPQYFGSRLEKIVAPRHAFLVYMDLPHGRELFDDEASTKWKEFVIASRKTKPFCALCNQWLKEKQQQKQQHCQSNTIQREPPITAKQIEAFDFLFGRGILAAARNELVQWNNTWPLQHVNITSSQILRLLIDHGANPLERDIRGTTVLHWASGTGNLEAVQELLKHFPNGLLETTERDGATPLHWAAAGANSKEFGTGGHVHVCQYLLSECTRQRRSQHSDDNKNILKKEEDEPPTAKQLVNQLTKDGNSPLMWAAWSASLDTVKLLIRHRAEWDLANQNGCTVAHWAASGGSLEVCHYLHNVVGVDFFVPNHGGNTPLTHAVAFGRTDIARWLKELSSTSIGNGNHHDLIAAQLAEDFVRWDSDRSEHDRLQRRKILELFQEEYWDLGKDSNEEEDFVGEDEIMY
ncbi:ankyrin repeat domain protein [Nitzschia inconspicua]|uniref:Ankyrin repeat domain protein n=1 Tax=Nitzschia inconspicua TaxID=303405 RepID=A0A9K3PTN2_9STRA|nr:ankyrin repeat domain protein [Nitzschia inconspicua]